MRKPQVDVQVENHGSIFVFQPLTKRGSAWITENVQAESWQWMGGGLCVEHRYARDLADGMQGDGLRLA
jgi:hypothetical protein